jgi:hypothetical protein
MKGNSVTRDGSMPAARAGLAGQSGSGGDPFNNNREFGTAASTRAHNDQVAGESLPRWLNEPKTTGRS